MKKWNKNCLDENNYEKVEIIILITIPVKRPHNSQKAHIAHYSIYAMVISKEKSRWQWFFPPHRIYGPGFSCLLETRNRLCDLIKCSQKIPCDLFIHSGWIRSFLGSFDCDFLHFLIYIIKWLNYHYQTKCVDQLTQSYSNFSRDFELKLLWMQLWKIFSRDNFIVFRSHTRVKQNWRYFVIWNKMTKSPFAIVTPLIVTFS